MPRRSKAQKDVLAAARLRAYGENPTVEEKLETVRSELKVAKATIGRFKFAQAQLVSSEEDYKELYKNLRNERRKVQRAMHIKILTAAAAKTAQEDAARAIALLEGANSENKNLREELSHLLERGIIERQDANRRIDSLEGILAETRHKARIYARQCERIPDVKRTAVKRANKENKKISLLHKGVYSPVAWDLARVLTKAGCSRDYVGKVISSVCKSAGIEVKGEMSRRTVGRAILEGGIAAKIQLAHEVLQAEGK